MTTITGYKLDQEGSYIPKDRLARLIYSMDWSEWLPASATIASVAYSVQTRTNDAAPPVIHTSGVQSGNTTYVEISGGSINKTYEVTAAITLNSGQLDRRSFRIKIENRSA